MKFQILFCKTNVEFNDSMLPSGVYFYRLEATGATVPGKLFTQRKKMLLLKPHLPSGCATDPDQKGLGIFVLPGCLLSLLYLNNQVLDYIKIFS